MDLKNKAFKYIYKISLEMFNNETNYIQHISKIAKLVKDYTENDNLEIVALLKDVLNYIDVSEEELYYTFGEEITNLVVNLTDDLSKEDDKIYQEKRINNMPDDLLLIKLINLLVNIIDVDHLDNTTKFNCIKDTKNKLKIINDSRKLSNKQQFIFHLIINKINIYEDAYVKKRRDYYEGNKRDI